MLCGADTFVGCWPSPHVIDSRILNLVRRYFYFWFFYSFPIKSYSGDSIINWNIFKNKFVLAPSWSGYDIILTTLPIQWSYILTRIMKISCYFKDFKPIIRLIYHVISKILSLLYDWYISLNSQIILNRQNVIYIVKYDFHIL